MFKVGDQVVHPLHGAGIVEAIETRGKEKEEYYVLRLFTGSLKVLVPARRAGQIGVRQVIDKRDIAGVFSVLGEDEHPTSFSNWNHRQRANLEKIRTGNIYAVAEVVRSLIRRQLRKGLSSGEKRMLDSAMQILISEIATVGGMEPDKVELMIKKIVTEN
ncbi:MAG TPA: CarD family transcriptional regulator [Syntrophomonadaceae bacterium]|nr:CarD family transcriptional regulator [Syntrophomonadaceae bacterium]